MNMLLLPADFTGLSEWTITQPRQIQHIQQVLKAQCGDTLKVGIQNGQRYLAEIVQLSADKCVIRPQATTDSNRPFSAQPPAKLPLTLVVALPRPKVLRRLVQDSVSMGVERIVIMHSYFVDKSYWSSPILQELDDAVILGLEQAQDTIAPSIVFEKRFKPFVEDRLATWIYPHCPAYVAHPYAEHTLPTQLEQACILIVGCERGFIPYEIDLLQKNGVTAVQFGQRILRTETSVPYAIGRLFSGR